MGETLMAHFAELGENNIVLRTVVISNDDILDSNGIEQESMGVSLCQHLFGAQTRWVQTSYNGNIRYRYAGIGFTYNAEADAFIEPQPFTSWVLDDNYAWQAPIPMPADSNPEDPTITPVAYRWNEETVSWEAFDPDNL